MKVGGTPTPDLARQWDPVYRAKASSSGPGQAGQGQDPGTLLKGRVVGVDSEGLFTITSGQGTFTASSAKTLAIGQEFWFQLVSGADKSVLVEAGKTQSVLNLLRVLLPEMLASRAEALPALLGGEARPELTPSEGRLLQWLTANVVDGKPDPAKLIKFLASLSSGTPLVGGEEAMPSDQSAPFVGESTSPALQKVLRSLELHAAVNQQPSPVAGGEYFLFPVFFAEQAGRGEWLFSYENHGDQEGGAETSLSFYLTMTQLGDIHLAINSRAKTLSGLFTLTDQEATDHVRQQLPSLIEVLRPYADTVTIRCRTGQFSCLQTIKEELMAKAGLAYFGLVDCKA